MGYTAKQLISIAEAEIGYHEKASNSNLDSTKNFKITVDDSGTLSATEVT